jgi:hypothetical protein
MTACEKRTELITLGNIHSTGCDTTVRNTMELWAPYFVIEYENGYIYVTHKNAMVNCGFTKVDVNFTITDNVIEIIEQEDPTNANCMCATDISYKIGEIDSGEYTLIIKFHDEIVYNQINIF